MARKDYDSYDYLYNEYVVKERSTKNIAEEHGTYPNTIRRLLKKHGFEVRNKSQAQKNYLDKNGSPMLGRKRTEEEKERISEGLQKYWSDMDDETSVSIRSKMSQNAQKQWEQLTDHQKKDSIYRMHVASKSKMYSGSKNENAVASMLEEEFRIDQRSRMYTMGKEFEIDVALIDHAVAVEWDGATHFMPIYGEEHLEKVMKKDKVKDKMLISLGWHVIRVRDHSTAHSKAFCRRSVELIINLVDKIRGSTTRPKVYYIDAK